MRTQWLKNYPLTVADLAQARYKLRLELQDNKDNALRHLLIALIMVMAMDILPSAALAGTNAEAFARMPTFSEIEISPEGRYFAARYNAKNKYVVAVFKIVGSEITYIYGFTENKALSVNWFEWVSSEKLLVSIGFTGRRRAQAIVQTSETRLVSLDVTTNELSALFRPKRGKNPVQIQDRIVSFLSSDPDHVLLQYPLPTRNHVRIDIHLTPDLGLRYTWLICQGNCFTFELRRVHSSSWHDTPPRPLSAFSDVSAIAGYNPFKAEAKSQLPWFCHPFVTDALVGRIVDTAVEMGRNDAEPYVANYKDKIFTVPSSNIVTEGVPAGLSDHIGQLRSTMRDNGFRLYALSAAVQAKNTNAFIPVTSALMLTGVGPTDNLTVEMLEAASPFDKIYVEPTANLDHGKTTTGWYALEVTALFDAL